MDFRTKIAAFPAVYPKAKNTPLLKTSCRYKTLYTPYTIFFWFSFVLSSKALWLSEISSRKRKMMGWVDRSDLYLS